MYIYSMVLEVEISCTSQIFAAEEQTLERQTSAQRRCSARDKAAATVSGVTPRLQPMARSNPVLKMVISVTAKVYIFISKRKFIGGSFSSAQPNMGTAHIKCLKYYRTQSRIDYDQHQRRLQICCREYIGCQNTTIWQGTNNILKQAISCDS